MKAIQGLLRRFDSIQQGNRVIGFPYAVVKKFGDDQAGYLAALVAYYAFFSLFPLLLVLTTILGFVLENNQALQTRIVDAVLKNFPVISQSFHIEKLHGSGIGLAVGLLFTLLAGVAVIQALQYAMDEVWGVPRRGRPNFFISRLRALTMLAILGAATLGATIVSNLVFPFGLIGSLLLNIVTLMVAFKVLTVADLSWSDVAPGAIAAGVALTILQNAGALLVKHTLKNASATYGTFAVVIGLLSWIYLGAQITLYAAEINVVKRKHLWPRSLLETPTPDDQVIDMRFDRAEKGSSATEEAPGRGIAGAVAAEGGRPRTRPRL